MKAYAYIFGAPMIWALLDGVKTQTRRKLSPHNCLIDGVWARKWPDLDWSTAFITDIGSKLANIEVHILNVSEVGTHEIHKLTPRAKPGNMMWVKEWWALGKNYDGIKIANITSISRQLMARWYRASEFGEPDHRRGKWRNPRYMPRWASRITRPIKDVRFEFIQNISEQDAVAEGIRPYANKRYCIYDQRDHSSTPWKDMPTSPIPVFRGLWDSLNASRGLAWDSNRPVLVTEIGKEISQ